MLRKEMKQFAQRRLRGQYGNWIPFVIVPVIFVFMIAVSGFSAGTAATNSQSGSWREYLDDYNQKNDANGYDSGEDSYDDGWNDDYYGDDYFDDYYDDLYTESNIAYQYGYALGYKEGYVQGWEDGKNNVGDGEYNYGHESDRIFDDKIIAAIKDKPEEFKDDRDFEDGILEGFEWGYWDAWDYAEYWSGDVIEGDTMALNLTHHSLVDTNDTVPATETTVVTMNESWLNRVLNLWLGWSFFIALLSILYRPFISWAGIDTLDGEQLKFKNIYQSIRERWQAVFGANVKIIVFTILWGLLFVIPGIVKMTGYSMTNYLLKREKELTSTEAIQLSQHLMQGYRMEYLIFQFSFFFWYAATICSFGLAGFYVIPYYATAEATFFDEIYYEKRRVLPVESTNANTTETEKVEPWESQKSAAAETPEANVTETQETGAKETPVVNAAETQEVAATETSEASVTETQETGIKETPETNTTEIQESAVAETPEASVTETQETGAKETPVVNAAETQEPDAANSQASDITEEN